EDLAYANVDFETMSRLVLARLWSQLSPAQQTEFVKLFREHLALTYGRNIESYNNEKVQVVSDHDEARGDWTVNTKILRGGGSAVVVHRENELRERLREPHQARHEDADRHAVEPGRRRPAEVHVDSTPLELLGEERENRADAPVHAPALDREAIVVGRQLLRDRLAGRGEGDEGGVRGAGLGVLLA